MSSFVKFLVLCILCTSCSREGKNDRAEPSPDRYTVLMKEMFSEMVEKKQANLIPYYYHPDLIVYTNGIEFDYKSFLDMHRDIYQTPIQYSVRYDDSTLLEEGERVAGMVYITTSLPDEEPKEIEVILIAQYKNNKIYRVWELTWPDWSKLEAFKDK